MSEDFLSSGQLERVLRRGDFALTAETTPPLSADAGDAVDRVLPLKGLADAVNVTDGAGARVHLSSLVTAAALCRAGIEPVLQFTCRDRNRLALQADLMGAAAVGAPNILCLGGDKASAGDEPEAKEVHDLDSAGLVALARRLRDEGRIAQGRELKSRPGLFIGVADLPVDPPADWRPTSLEAKIAAGADFAQTQYCFDIERARRYVGRLRDLGITEKLHMLIGIGPLASARQARWMRENLFGVEIPDAIVDRLAGAEDEPAEGRAICRELLWQLAEIPGVAGAHLMAPRQEAACAQVIVSSGLLARRARA